MNCDICSASKAGNRHDCEYNICPYNDTDDVVGLGMYWVNKFKELTFEDMFKKDKKRKKKNNVRDK